MSTTKRLVLATIPRPMPAAPSAAPAPVAAPSKSTTRHTLVAGLSLDVDPNMTVQVTNVGTVSAPAFLVTPQTGNLVTAVARPIVRQIAKSSARRAVVEADDDAPDESVFEQDAQAASEISGLPVTFYGYDQMGAILIDSDGKRVEI